MSTQISEFTKDLAQRYRQAKAEYLGDDARARPHEEIEQARRAFQLAAQDLATSVLDDIDTPAA